MCTTWTQEQWKKASNDPNSVYSVVGTFKDAGGNEALQVAEIYPSGDSYYWNIYSLDGKDHAFYYAQPEANGRLEARGFTPVVAAQVDTPATETPVDGAAAAFV